MNIWLIVGLVVSHVVAFGGGVVLHSVLMNDLKNLLATSVTVINNAIAKLPKV